MRNRASRSADRPAGKGIIIAVAAILLVSVAVSAFFLVGSGRYLTLRNGDTDALYRRFRVKNGDVFRVGFIHSVNQSPVTNYFEIRDDGIYVIKTVYYGFGAGVLTELEEGQTLEYGEDGSMIVSGFNRKIEPLIYRVGTVSDHIFCLREEEEISLRDLCGRNAKVVFAVE